MKHKPKLPVILIADDSADDRELLARRLEKAGVENPLVFAESGEATIELLRSTCRAAGARNGEKPALVFLDINMPPGDGIRVLEWIRKKPAFGGMRVVMMTDSTRPEDLKRAKELNADGYFLKHPHAETIAFLVRTVMAAQLDDPTVA